MSDGTEAGESAVAGELRRTIVSRLSQWYGLVPADIDDDRPFAELGITSRDAVALTAELRALTSVQLPATLLWEAPTLGRLLSMVEAAERESGTVAPAPRIAPAPPPVAWPGAVAVVGIGCRLPGGITSAAGFWELLSTGGNAVGTLPEGRWGPFLPDGAPPEGISRHGAFLPDVAGFDAEFFGISPHEATLMDPQQRLLLEVARESLDHAAIPAPGLAGTSTGVFIGISGNEYAQLTTADLDAVDAWTPPGAALSIAANRLSYALDLRGPSLAVDTACSSSLVAVHHAVRSLVSGETDTALAGGVNLLLSPALTLAFQRAGALAPDGRCKTFDAAADGMVRGEGCAVVVLKRLSDAERDGNRVLAVIRSTAVNSDGRSNGLLAPNPEAQRALLEQAHAGDGGELDYVEAHGTGTALGDPIEAHALGAVLGRGREPDQPLLIGSAKTNVGHLEAAAGITGLVKTVLALHHDELPPHRNFGTPNPLIDFDALGLRVVDAPEPWPRYSGRATAGVSAFGFGGTNAHVVLEEYRPAPHRAPPPGAAPSVTLLDALSAARLRADAAGLSDWLTSSAARGATIEDVARTLHGRTGRGRYRAAVVAGSREDAAEAFACLAEGRPHPAVVTGGPAVESARPVWVFSGYGSQWPGMARRLLTAEPAFAEAVELLEPLLLEHAGLTLRELLEPGAELSSPSVVQPVLYALQVALAGLWRAYGIEPAAVIGHSMGEVAAAVVAGALDVETGTRVIATRSRLLDGLSGGAMAVVEISAAQVTAHAVEWPSLRVAVHSSPGQSVVTGTADDIGGLIARVEREGGLARSLGVTAAGHSPQVDPLLGPLAEQLGAVAHTPPRVPFYGTVLDSPREVPVFDTGYWVAGLRRPVRFAQAVAAAAADGHRLFVEVSPHPTQLHPLAETLRASDTADTAGTALFATLRRNADDAFSFRHGLAGQLVRGVPVDGGALHGGGRIVDVPSGGWRHRDYWVKGRLAARRQEPESLPVPVVEDPVARPRTVVDRLREHVAQVMGYAPEHIDPGTPLTELGLDSLMAARILAAVARDFGTVVEPRVLLRGGTVAALADWLEAPDDDGSEPSSGDGFTGVLPRDAAERMVAGAWQSVAGGRPPGAEDDLGLQELPAERRAKLAQVLSERAGWEVPAADLLRGPATVAGIAGLLRPRLEAPVSGPLRVLREGGSRPPLFLIHPAGGSTAVYRALVQRLGDDQPCYGLERLPGPDAVHERAAAYARLVRETRPQGPWLLGGWSYGGVVAQETARLLAADGSVPALILIDSVLPLPVPELPPLEEARRRFADFAAYVGRTYGSPLPLPYEELATLDDAGQIALVVKALEQAADLPAAVLEHQRTSYLDLRSGERHTPRPYAGRTLLYRATRSAPHTVQDARYIRTDEALGWDGSCQDLSVTPIEGDHLSLLDPPAVDDLAARLNHDLGLNPDTTRGI
ncbi:beta-ketoacyl synthase N-terminal-like domain-containing protein [Streptomyces sp. H39-S7]|uniref:beta-ketoacyl synthase N-terminal-like domain-containing protein n=1 Tax=Streptomyces sp. H39-S7 TaxID=3004357 RepID=UPI0022AF5C82|nr:beta-ketoacyl synthase N-terminal-like domain-containing protein [Streptomyces sp. H39-S7]MCZ4119423.1 beta-ketoacyl synthase N-terminal-like domain-containing protein [Streptomyces sp. H39-S7]